LDHVTSEIDRLLAIMARLRDPEGGCPWDLEQSFGTIAPYTIEEAYEVADAIERRDMAALRDELGDLLLQVVYHAQMAAELTPADGAFRFEDVARAICDKMVRRHPHVFGGATVESAAAQTQAWEAQKAAERGASTLAGVARGLPALLRAFKLQGRAARVGFDWPNAEGALDKLREELDELTAEMTHAEPSDRLAEEVGDVLFSAVNLARELGIEPEDALRRGNAKFEARFAYVEQSLAAAGRRLEDTPLEDMETLWQEAKTRAKNRL
jgi:MazG family protein